MAYCPIADIENADLAYAWLRYDSTVKEDGSLSETAGNYEFTEFQLALQEDAAYAFAEYINSLNLKDENGNALSFDFNEDGSVNPRSGSCEVTDLAGFINGTGLVRNKDIPGFDTLDLSAENDAFGTSDTKAVHYSVAIAALLQEHYDTYQKLDGFDQEQIDLYIQNALTGD